MKLTLVLQGNTLTYENDAVNDASEMGHAFGDGEEGHEYCHAKTWQDFIGTAFHLIQQTGGKLSVNGYVIHAANFADTDGSSVSPETNVILANGETVLVAKFLVTSGK